MTCNKKFKNILTFKLRKFSHMKYPFHYIGLLKENKLVKL